MIPSKEQFEHEFEAFLSEDGSRLAALYRKLPQAEPDAKIDAAVLAMAHRALNPELVATPLGNATSRRRPRWIPAIGLAAGVVFAASVALRVGPQMWTRRDAPIPAAASDDGVIHVRPIDETVPPPPPASPAPPPNSLPTPAVTEAAPVAANSLQPPTGLAQPKPTAAPVPVRESLVKKQAQDEVVAKPSSFSDLTDVGADKQAEKAKVAASKNAAPQAFPAQVRAQAEMDATERTQAAARGAWWPSHAEQAGLAKPGAVPANAPESMKAQANLAAPAPAAQLASPPPVAATASATATAPPAQEPATRSKKEAHAADTGGASAEAESAAAPSDAKTDATPQTSYSADVIRNSRLYPESWIAAIHRLIRDGHRDEAMQNLDLFRKKYPDYRLPADLQDLLSPPK